MWGTIKLIHQFWTIHVLDYKQKELKTLFLKLETVLIKSDQVTELIFNFPILAGRSEKMERSFIYDINNFNLSDWQI